MPLPRDDEALFSRDDDDRLIVRERASRERFKDLVTIAIDGETVTLPRCLPVTDALGNVLREPDGLPKPRNSTIYDAARELVNRGTWSDNELAKRIPVLCHREHLNPVAACRMCSVHVSKKRKRDGKLMPSPKLVPACQHEVQPDMIVTTWCGGGEFADEVAGPIRVLAELLTADHVKPDPVRDSRTVNELQAVANRLNATPRPILSTQTGRNAGTHAKARPLDLVKEFPYSGRTITVDHDRCILCDRCTRSCHEVKPFAVIGHTGKGYGSRISFDLDATMDSSSCVQCGECMTACPTGALTLNRRVAPTTHADAPPIPPDPATPLPAGFGFLTAEQMLAVELVADGKPFRPFATVPFAYLKWNEGAVRLRQLKPGDVLCREGEFGSSAYLLRTGIFEIRVNADGGGWFGKSAKETVVGTADANALILGELAALANQRRTATIVAASDADVYEVTRNVLAMVQRSPSARDVLGTVYSRNAVRSCLRSGSLFAGLSDAERNTVSAYLNEPGRAELRRADAGETIVAEGAEGHDFYVVRRGFVKVVRRGTGQERVLAKLGPDGHFGEIALLADHPAVVAALPPGQDPRRRTASVVALDPVEVVRIPCEAFRELGERFPAIRDRLAAGCVAMLTANRKSTPVRSDHLSDFVDQGLHQGQKLLVLDLVACTRCDECTRACADSHGDGVSRLLRVGQRFGDYLVATSCRSCRTPYCMDGCPVDAIHRTANGLEVRIDDHCIGCGLCEQNCPYGSIHMVPRDDSEAERGAIAAVARRAVNCDLCHDLVPAGADPFCVAACPHEAAFRWDGERLLAEVVRS